MVTSVHIVLAFVHGRRFKWAKPSILKWTGRRMVLCSAGVASLFFVFVMEAHTAFVTVVAAEFLYVFLHVAPWSLFENVSRRRGSSL